MGASFTDIFLSNRMALIRSVKRIVADPQAAEDVAQEAFVRVGFVGLVVPHLVRWFVGPDQRWIILMSIIYGPVLLLAADIVGRLILFPGELEAGIVTAFLGAPALILLARRRQASGL